MMEKDKIRNEVRKTYGAMARHRVPCCGTAPTSGTQKRQSLAGENATCCESTPGCGTSNLETAANQNVGYTDEQLAAIPEEAFLGLGCGNPTALASLRQGETVLDLGAGAGIDCFLAAKVVGETGRVIGVDMTAEMLDRARENAAKHHYANVEFRLGEIENLPVADGSVDAILSNCVINLSPEKQRVFAEAYRVLKPGGRMVVSDIVLLKDLPETIKDDVEAYVACIAGASRKEEYLAMIRDAGFRQIELVSERPVGMERPEASNCSGAPQEIKPSHPQIAEELAEFERFAQPGTAEVFATSIQVRAMKPVSGEKQGG